MVAFGVERAQAEEWVAAHIDPAEREPYAVWPDNWDTLQIFLACETQWRILAGSVGGAVFIGLDYAAVWAALNGLYPRKERAGIFYGICIMERAAMRVLNKRKE